MKFSPLKYRFSIQHSLFDIRYSFAAYGKPVFIIQLPTATELAGPYRETYEKPNLEDSRGEALGVRKLACAFCLLNIINALRRQLRARSIRAALINTFRDRNRLNACKG
jgi:hypothetical protein